VTGSGQRGEPVLQAGLAARIIAAATARQLTLATAESLTGGLLAAALTTVPGASVVFRGGVVAYAADLKARLLGVQAELLERRGAVDPDVASAMAAGARRAMAASLAVATTGVAGPDPAYGKPVGTVYVAVCGQDGGSVTSLALSGSRAEIREAAVAEALRLLIAKLEQSG
jgi:nicotinamide-nucleotide amidase